MNDIIAFLLSVFLVSSRFSLTFSVLLFHLKVLVDGGSLGLETSLGFEFGLLEFFEAKLLVILGLELLELTQFLCYWENRSQSYQVHVQNFLWISVVAFLILEL